MYATARPSADFGSTFTKPPRQIQIRLRIARDSV